MGGKLTNQKFKDRVFEMCDTLGFWNCRGHMIAKKLGTSQQNVSRWKQEYIKKFGVPDVKQYALEMNVNSIAALKELTKLTKHNDPKIRLQAINALFNAQDKYSTFLENFGWKDKVAEKIDIEQQTDQKMIDVHILKMVNNAARKFDPD